MDLDELCLIQAVHSQILKRVYTAKFCRILESGLDSHHRALQGPLLIEGKILNLPAILTVEIPIPK